MCHLQEIVEQNMAEIFLIEFCKLHVGASFTLLFIQSLLEWTTVASELHFNLYPLILYLAIYQVGNKAKRLLSENDFTKPINQLPNLTAAVVGVTLQITLSDLTTVAVGDRLNVFITVYRYITFL